MANVLREKTRSTFDFREDICLRMLDAAACTSQYLLYASFPVEHTSTFAMTTKFPTAILSCDPGDPITPSCRSPHDITSHGDGTQLRL
jgi:hypothetical protein